MNKINNINTLNGLLEKFKETTTPILLILCVRCDNHFLTDQVVRKVEKTYDVGYYHVSQEASKSIKNELQIIDNPALIIIENGELKAILKGIVAQHQLEKALHELLLEKNNQAVKSLGSN